MATVEQSPPPVKVRPPRTLPLNLTPFEDYMIWDDRPEYPMTFVVQMEFAGTIDREAIEAALPDALERHPLLQAIVQPAKGNRDCWVNAPQPEIAIDWGDLAKPIDLPAGEAIDVRQDVGLRIWIRSDENQATITTQFHHATCDGIGAYQFLGDWLWFYASHVGQPIDEPLPPLDVKALRQRNRNSFDVENYRLPDGKLDTAETKALGWHCLTGVQALAIPRSMQPEANPRALFPGLCGFEFDKNVYKNLRHVAERRGQSTNELLIERLLVTLRQWNQMQGDRGRRDLCIMMPMDLREIESRMATAANLVTYALIRRKQSECTESEALIDSIRQEMVMLKRNRLRTPFMSMIAHLQRYPTWLKRWLGSRRCMATAILSNTGDPTKRFSVAFPRVKGLLQAGNLSMTDIVGVPPMRSGTRLTISIFTYRRVLKICMRCDPHYYSTAQTEALANEYRASIQRLLDAPVEA
ncbi:acyltransferase PapA5 [Rosistilla ulvae]|uniref:Acyltransferase PapA5 n=1 Tax=Rosistilla ulvae TaxID=1930277 RepID=A0A517M629_9BACT|nr:chromosome condensation protein [Rosistilla ulvae]QDS90330.1 acyltransferase PapA5 [Rosistilla ulvae]